MFKIVPAILTTFLLLLIGINGREIAPDINERRTGCGGAIQGDSGTLKYPQDGESSIPGELCIWTLHLDGTDGFRINFPKLDINGGNGNCSSGALSIHSLTHLNPQGIVDGYRFCNEATSPGRIYLLHNVLTVTFYSSLNVSNSNSSNGFEMHWEGAASNSLPTNHVSSFSSASSGVIRYPVDEEYPPNSAITWLVSSPLEANESLQIQLESLDFDRNCKHVDNPCLCDALIIYEISESGNAVEIERFCGERSNLLIPMVDKNLIIAFFSDENDEPSSGLGFELVYKVSKGPIVSTKCNEVLVGSSGSINVNASVMFYERCTWTIRTPGHSAIKLVKEETPEWTSYWNYLLISSFSRDGNELKVQNEHLGRSTRFEDNNGRRELTVNASVIVVTFIDEPGTNVSAKFMLHFEGVGEPDSIVNHGGSKDFILDSFSGSIDYPGNGKQYSNNELTIFANPRTYNPDTVEWLTYTFSDIGLRTCNNGSTTCCDFIQVFEYESNMIDDSSDFWLEPVTRVCNNGNGTEVGQEMFDSAVLVLSTDSSEVDQGIRITW